MRELAADDFHYVLYEDETTGHLYLRAVCNQSAAYFFVDLRLLPEEARVVFSDAEGRTVTAAGRQLLGELADAAQWSQSAFLARREAAWQALGFGGEPAVPRLDVP
ncbi:MAG: hypothetical protein NT062_13795 [Proteobacteria bacterium]|nr:hypothetical protein [Pseudomonadota bacterium]